MAKGTTIGCKRKTRNKVRLEKKGSDESDEDYKVSEDEEVDESEDEYCSSLVGDESEKSLGKYIDDEEDEDDEVILVKVENVGRPKTSKGRRQVKKKKQKKKNKIVRSTKKKATWKDVEEEDDYDDYEDGDDDDFCDVKQRKRNKAFHKKGEDDDTDISSEDEDDEFVVGKPKKMSRVSRAKTSRNTNYKNPSKKNTITFKEENEDVCDDEDGTEFTPYEDLERVTRRVQVKRQTVTRQNRSDTSKVSNDERTPTVTKKKRTGRGGGRRRKYSVNSDSDIASSGSSDCDYTVSEEERELVREGTEFCRGLAISLRSSSPLRTNNEEAQTKTPGKKGKEKVSDMKIKVVKQVCGICLSEEGKRTIRGALNCCSHYFCFACIMEWSKVESRCPLCKQRFTIINRNVRSDGAHDLRDAVFNIPERDQVYQPSEEELRGYLDPYEGVLCTECHLGGDDAVMLLCDLCDSPAHTYCVGLGFDVPEGNWYCDGCRPANISSNQQTLNPTLDHGTADIFAVNSSPMPTSRETFDLNEAYVPDTPLTQVSGSSQSPRTFIGDRQSSSSFPSGYGALTLLERRRIQRQIQQLLTSRGRRFERNESPAHTSGINLFGSRISPSRTVITQPNVVIQPSIMHQNINAHRRLEYVSSSFCAREASSSSRQSDLRAQALRNEASASVDLSYGGGLVAQQSNFLGFNASSGGGGFVHHQLHPCIGRSSNNGTNVSVSPYEAREGTLPSRSLQGPVYTHHF